MALKRIITASRFISLRPHDAEEYVEQPDGTYKLDLVEADGTPAPLPPPPEEVDALKSAHEKTKREVRELKEQIAAARAAAKAGDNAAIIAERQKRIGEIEERIAATDADFKQKQADQDAHYTIKFAEANTKIAKAHAEYDGHLLDHTLEKVIHAQRGAVALLAPKLARYVKVIRDESGENPRVAAFDENGTLRTNPATGELVTVDQVLQELRAFDPALSVCFESSNGNGPH
jgi:hypothetical protein